MKGYGEMIKRAREAVPWDHAQLAKKVDRTISTVRRWEDETNEPSIDSINLLVENLPLSTEMLLKAMGAKLTPIGATMTLLGHKSPVMTLRYSEAGENDGALNAFHAIEGNAPKPMKKRAN